MSLENSSIRDELVDCLSQQLSEIDLLQAMYPNPGDIIISEKNVADINNFIECKTEYVPNNLDFILNLFISDLKLELFINLPLSYPNEEPDIYMRSNQLNRQQETSVNIGLSEYLKNNHMSEVCLYTAITWLQDNIDTFLCKDIPSLKCNDMQDQIHEDNKFCRMWIYSHHIYNKKKREEILKEAKEFNLTGFCLPGKPGVICIEGDDRACNEWWRVIKSMSWKKIMVRKTELFESLEETEQRKFSSFEELHLNNPINSKHANMSEFSKFMSKHGFGQIFSDIFGLCND